MNWYHCPRCKIHMTRPHGSYQPARGCWDISSKKEKRFPMHLFNLHALTKPPAASALWPAWWQRQGLSRRGAQKQFDGSGPHSGRLLVITVLSPLRTTFLKPPPAFTNRYSSPKCKCYVSHTCYGFALALMHTVEGTQVASVYIWRSARRGMTEARDVLPAMPLQFDQAATKRISYAHLTLTWHHGSNLQISRIFKCSSLFSNRQF